MSSSKRLASTYNKETSTAIAFVAGIAAVLMGYSVYSHLKTLHDRNALPKKNTPKSGAKLEDCMFYKKKVFFM